MRLCATCKQLKSNNEFYGKPRPNNCYCKICARKRNRTYYKAHRDEIIAKVKKYSSSDNYKQYDARRSVEDKAIARAKLRYAVKTGVIQKLPCKVCGSKLVQAHHPFGYAGENALKVEWLCSTHHGEVHRISA